MTYEDFQKVEIRVGKILAAEKVPDTDKLLRLEVDFGEEKRQIISGIAEAYTEPEKLVGKLVPFVVNLEPRVIRGFESSGMILAAHDENNKPVILTVDGDVPEGAKVS
ncbi:MAG TPA: methionine--tRNA ligase subunit beta [Candidatus Saccharimonadales bacterium]|nr:methionine--tRNA ligase subunit beta [Candidatus Saccharimonadales bacterium]